MEWSFILTNLVSFGLGVTADYFKGLGGSSLVRRRIRNAVKVEISGILVSLNFYIMAKIRKDPGSENDALLLTHHLGDRPELKSATYFHDQKQDQFLELPEWVGLKDWNDTLRSIGTGPHPPMFTAIMLFRRLAERPLRNCVSQDSLGFVRGVLVRPEVDQYWTRYIIQTAAAATKLPPS